MAIIVVSVRFFQRRPIDHISSGFRQTNGDSRRFREEAKRDGMSTKRNVKNAPVKQGPRLSRARLDELVEEALVDADTESQPATSFYTRWKTTSGCPLKRRFLAQRQAWKASISPPTINWWPFAGKVRPGSGFRLWNLPLPSPPPVGAEWIVAYRYWRTGAV
jgi:hypothetical protein